MYQRSQLKQLADSGRKEYFEFGKHVILQNDVHLSNDSTVVSRSFKRRRLGEKCAAHMHEIEQDTCVNVD